MSGINQGPASLMALTTVIDAAYSTTTLQLNQGEITTVSALTKDDQQTVAILETLTASTASDDSNKHYFVAYVPYTGPYIAASASASLSTTNTGTSIPLSGTAAASGQQQQVGGASGLTTTPTSAASATVSVSPTASASATPSATAKPAGKKSNVGAIAGGVVGGLVIIAIILALLIWARRRKQKQRRVAAETAVPTKGNASYDEPPTQGQTSQPVYQTASHQPPKAYDPVPAPAPAPATDRALERPAYATNEPKSLAPTATTSKHEVHMPMSREVNEDGVSLRSASPDLTDAADRHSFIEEAGPRGVPRLPRQDRENGVHGSAL
jgi:hypothetical protein